MLCGQQWYVVWLLSDFTATAAVTTNCVQLLFTLHLKRWELTVRSSSYCFVLWDNSAVSFVVSDQSYCALKNYLWSFWLEFLRWNCYMHIQQRLCLQKEWAFYVNDRFDELCRQKSWLMPLPLCCSEPHPIANLTWHFILLGNPFYQRRHAIVGKSTWNYMAGHQSERSWRKKRDGWEACSHTQKQLHCNLLMLPFKPGHVTPR